MQADERSVHLFVAFVFLAFVCHLFRVFIWCTLLLHLVVTLNRVHLINCAQLLHFFVAFFYLMRYLAGIVCLGIMYFAYLLR